jgi:hypothetical protein
VIQRVLAVPAKRFDKQLITFLSAAEIDALVAAPDASRGHAVTYAGDGPV